MCERSDINPSDISIAALLNLANLFIIIWYVFGTSSALIAFFLKCGDIITLLSKAANPNAARPTSPVTQISS